MDDADRAAAEFLPHEFAMRINHLASTRPEAEPGYSGFDGARCVDCLEFIPPARLKLGACRCVECKTLLERKR